MLQTVGTTYPAAAQAAVHAIEDLWKTRTRHRFQPARPLTADVRIASLAAMGRDADRAGRRRQCHRHDGDGHGHRLCPHEPGLSWAAWNSCARRWAARGSPSPIAAGNGCWHRLGAMVRHAAEPAFGAAAAGGAFGGLADPDRITTPPRLLVFAAAGAQRWAGRLHRPALGRDVRLRRLAGSGGRQVADAAVLRWRCYAVGLRRSGWWRW